MQRPFLSAGLAVLAFIAVGDFAHAQQNPNDLRPLLDRLDRLERDVNMLQRQVYRGSGATSAPVPGSASGDAGGTAANLEIRMGQLEAQMRDLTGRVEETSYKIDQLRQNLEKLQSDLEFRLSALEHGGTAVGARPAAATVATQSGSGAGANAPVVLRAPGGDSAGMRGTSEPAVLGTITTTGPGGSAAAAPTGGATTRTAAVLPDGSPQDQYNYAFGLLSKARYDDAEQALRAFVQRNPKDPLAGNAQYWLGETYYVRKDYNNAAVAFAEGYEKYPKNVKAPDNLLKLGMSLGNLGQKDNACRAYARLDRDYPQAPSEVKDRATAEKKRLGCTG